MDNGNNGFVFGPPMLDEKGCCISFDPLTGLVRVDGIPVFALITGNAGMLLLQFYDGDKLRSKHRRTRKIEIPLQVVVDKLKALSA